MSIEWMPQIQGMSIILLEKEKSGEDAFHFPIYREKAIEVENVLVGLPTTDDITSSLSLYGKKAVYTLGIPKNDLHDWKDKKVQFFGETWRTFGFPIEGIEANIPGQWNKKVMVERYG